MSKVRMRFQAPSRGAADAVAPAAARLSAALAQAHPVVDLALDHLIVVVVVDAGKAGSAAVRSAADRALTEPPLAGWRLSHLDVVPD